MVWGLSGALLRDPSPPERRGCGISALFLQGSEEQALLSTGWGWAGDPHGKAEEFPKVKQGGNGEIVRLYPLWAPCVC